MKKILLLLFVSLTCYAQPDWINNSQRQVIGNSIVHWGIGNSESPSVAIFKARQMATKQLLEECGGFAHKEIIPRKSYIKQLPNGTWQGWALVSSSFDACNYGRTRNPDKQFENPKIIEAQKLYDQIIKVEAIGYNHNSEEDEPTVILQRKLYEWIAKEQDEIFSKQDSDQDALMHEVNTLKREMETLRAEIKWNKQPVAPLRIPANSSMKQMCWEQYKQYNALANMKAANYHGNLAHPAVVEFFNQAEMQKETCVKLK